MKKYLSLVLALIMALSLCACNDDEESPTLEGTGTSNSDSSSDGASGTSANALAQFSGKLLEPTMQMVASKSYMYEMKDTASTTDPISFATVGGKSLITYTNDSGVPVSFIKMNGKYYVVSSANSAYGEITAAVASQYGMTLDSIAAVFDAADFTIFLSCSYKASGTASIGTATYQYEDYYNPVLQHTNRFFFDQNGTLMYMTTIESDGSQGALSSLAVYTATESVFDILNSYQLVDLNGAQSAGTAGTTATAQ